MKLNNSNLKFVVASDVSNGNGVGIEVYLDNELILEIFRDDSKRKREVTLYKKDLDLDVIERSIEKFKNEIQWEFSSIKQ